MSRRQPMLALLLAFAVAHASATCACGLTDADDRGTSDRHHAHHGADVAQPSAACIHADCGSDCDIAARIAKFPAPAEPLGTAADPDDGTAFPVQPSASAFAAGTLLNHHPPPRPLLPADSPVHRFDKLLN